MSDKKIAIMGGTFDPIHYGHLASAEAVRSVFGMDRIVFIPSGLPPHKRNSRVTDSETRYLMTSYAIAPNANFDISKIEVNESGDSYTIDTVRKIKDKMTNTDIYFIAGADAVLEILSWHNSDELLRMCGFIAITRPGYNADKLNVQLEFLRKEKGADISLLEVPALAISSTDIRNKVRDGISIKYLVPDSVENFIYKYNLYRK